MDGLDDLAHPVRTRITIEIYVLAVTGGLLVGAAPDSASSAFVFVGVAAGGFRVALNRAAPLIGLGTLAVAVSILIYNGSGLGLVAYALGFAATALAASNSRQSVQRAEQAELLLAQIAALARGAAASRPARGVDSDRA